MIRFSLNQLVAAICALAVFMASFIVSASVRRADEQCPTAPVQSIVVVSCCPKPILSFRAPKPGDKEFKRCECGQKTAAATTQATRELRKDPALPVRGADLSAMNAPYIAEKSTRFAPKLDLIASLPNSPPVPPPNIFA